MDERSLNIDLVFRNGLKDMEVLPPPEVWENIHPSIPVKNNSFKILRVAAMIVVLMSLSFLAYRWSMKQTEMLSDTAIAFNIEAIAPVRIPQVPVAEMKENRPHNPSAVVESAASDITKVIFPDEDVEKSNSSSAFVQVQDESENASLRALKNLARSSSSGYFEEPANTAGYEKVIENNGGKWSLGAVASPTYYSRMGGGQDPAVEQLKSAEQAQISYTGGVAFYYNVSKRFSIQSGIYYSSVGQEISGINSFAGFHQYDMTKGAGDFEVITTRGRVTTENPDVFLIANGSGDRVITKMTSDVFDPVKSNLQYVNNSLQQNLSYVELPIMLRYKLVDRTIDLNVIGGVWYNMLVNNNVFTYINGDKYTIGRTEGLSPITFSSALGMGLEYSISTRFAFNVEPTFRYYLDPFNPIEGSTLHPFSFGLFSGVRYRF